MWWVDEIKDNIYYQKIKFGDVTIAADTHITPTATNPLSGLDALSSDGHLVLGSFRVHFKPQPRLRNTPLRTMSTTGSVTRKNYSRSKAGDKASIHHTYGFTIIELKEDGNIYLNDLYSWANIYKAYGLAKDNEEVIKILNGEINE